MDHVPRHRALLLSCADALFLAITGAVAALVMQATHRLGIGLVLSVVLGVVLAMLVQSVLALAMPPILSSIESTVPSMLARGPLASRGTVSSSQVPRVWDRRAKQYDFWEGLSTCAGDRTRRCSSARSAEGRCCWPLERASTYRVFRPASRGCGRHQRRNDPPRARPRGRAYRGEVSFVRADAMALPFPDGSFDTAITSCMLCSVPDPMRALGELHRVLRPDGRLRHCPSLVRGRPAAARNGCSKRATTAILFSRGRDTRASGAAPADRPSPDPLPISTARKPLGLRGIVRRAVPGSHVRCASLPRSGHGGDLAVRRANAPGHAPRGSGTATDAK